MRIAVAGGGGLGYLLASQISLARSAHNVIVLSRTPKPEYEPLDIQVQIVDYYRHESLQYALQGVDLVISTVSGIEQVNLILAAGEGEVRHFVPAEFEGKLSQRPAWDDPTTGGSTHALALLHNFEIRNRMKYTVFSCGVFMEIFHPMGLGHFDIGFRSGVSHTGSYLLNIPETTVEYVGRNAQGQAQTGICLTSIYDLVHFVVLALEMGLEAWPNEFTLRGERLSVQEVAQTCSFTRNVTFNHLIRDYSSLQIFVEICSQNQDEVKARYYRRLMATADGRYDFPEATLNEILSNSQMMDFVPMTLSQWLAKI